MIVGLVGGGATLYRWWVDRGEERRKRDEDRLTAVIAGLGSPDELARINAAHNLLTFLEPGYERFYPRILYLVVAHLLQPEPKPQDRQLPLQPKSEGVPLPHFTQALVTLFKEAYPKVRARAGPSPVWRETVSPSDLSRTSLAVREGSPLDMSGIQLPGAYLVQADLSGVWMPTVDLSGAALSNANLDLAHLRAAHLNGALLRGANLSGADLSEAILTDADLIEIGNGAILTDADLTGAILAGADLRGAIGLTPEQCQRAAEQGAIL